MDEVNFSKRSSHIGGEVKLYTMSYKRDVVKFAQEHSINLAASRFGVDRKRIREWVRGIDEVSSTTPTKKRHDGGGWKPVIMEIEAKLLKWIHEWRSRILHVSQKTIRAKAKAMFDEGNIDPAIQDSFVESNVSIQKFTKRLNDIVLIMFFMFVFSQIVCKT